MVPTSACIMVPAAEGRQGQWCHAQAAQQGTGIAMLMHAPCDVAVEHTVVLSCNLQESGSAMSYS